MKNKEEFSLKTLYDENGDATTHYMKGNVSIEVFIEALKRYYGENDVPVEAKNPHAFKVDVWRFVPSKGGEFNSVQHKAVEGSRGAFVATYLEVNR